MFIERLIYPEPNSLRIDIGPISRPFYLKQLLRRDGLDGVKENRSAAYCALPLTSAPEDLKPFIIDSQKTLLDILKESGITGYDPNSAPYSPDKGLDIEPPEVFRTDTSQVARARFFTFLDLVPSTGAGVEERTALDYNRIPIIIHNPKIRTSRMQINRAIHLQCANLEKQAGRLYQLFRYLQGFEPGIGFDGNVPALLGFQNRSVVNLVNETYRLFPDLKYTYNKNSPSVRSATINPEIFQ